MQHTHRTAAWLIGFVLVATACSGDNASDTTTTLPDFTSVITPGTELAGSAGALANAHGLVDAGSMAEAVAAFDVVIANYGDSSDLDTQRDVVDAYFGKAVTQTAMGATEDAIQTYADMATNTPDTPDLDITEKLSLGLVNRGNLLTRLERYEDAVAAFDEMLTRFATRPELEIKLHLVGAAVGKGDALVNLNRIGEAVFVYDLAVVEAGTYEDLPFEQLQVSALVGKANALVRGGDLKQAAANFNLVLDAWTGNRDEKITQLVAAAAQSRKQIAAAMDQPGVPGSCLFLEEGDCVLRDRFPERANFDAPFLPYIVAFNLEQGTQVYVPFPSVVEEPTTVEGTSEVIVVFSVPATDTDPESRCSIQFIPEGPLAITAGEVSAGAVVGTIADDRLSAPAETGFIYNLTISCLVRDPAADDRFVPDTALTDRLFGQLPSS